MQIITNLENYINRNYHFIEHCKTCQVENQCFECKDGYILNFFDLNFANDLVIRKINVNIKFTILEKYFRKFF